MCSGGPLNHLLLAVEPPLLHVAVDLSGVRRVVLVSKEQERSELGQSIHPLPILLIILVSSRF